MATLATRFGWSYEALIAMTGAERRLWIAAAERIVPGATGRVGPVSSAPSGATTATGSAEAPQQARLTTEAERKARLLELSQEYAARYRR